MTVEEISMGIDFHYQVTRYPSMTRVQESNKVHLGYFQIFSDYQELRKQHKYRFIPKRNIAALRAERDKTGKLNPAHSIIIDCANVQDVYLVRDEN